MSAPRHQKLNVERLTKDDYRVLADFRFTLRRFLSFSERAARKSGLTPQQYQALLAIEGAADGEGMTIGDLAGQLLIAHQSAVGLANRLEALQLVERAVCPEDRRRVRLSLTDEGRGALDKLYRIHRAELSSIGPSLASQIRRASEENGM